MTNVKKSQGTTAENSAVKHYAEFRMIKDIINDALKASKNYHYVVLCSDLPKMKVEIKKTFTTESIIENGFEKVINYYYELDFGGDAYKYHKQFNYWDAVKKDYPSVIASEIINELFDD